MSVRVLNAHRGEIAAVLDGAERRLCLTLGALAALEAAFGEDDLSALAARLSGGRLRAEDLAAVIHAGLCGAGSDATLDEVKRMTAPGGAAGYARIAVALLEATFAGEGA